MHFLNTKVVASLLSVLALSPSVFAAGNPDELAIADPDSAVVKLTADSFESFMKENPLVLAEFFAPWCGHCKRLGPEFSSAADILAEKNENIKLAQIDCTEERDLCADYGIRGYPTLKVFRGLGEPSDYSGQRVSESIVSYMTKQSLPPVSIFDNTNDLTDLIAESAEPVFLQVVPSSIIDSKSTLNTTFYEVANVLRDDYIFAQTSDDSYVEKYCGKDLSKPAYVLFRPNEEIEDASIFDVSALSAKDESDDTHFIHFLDVEGKPLFGEINGSTFQSYMDMKIPLAYYFYNDESEKETASKTINEIAKKYRGKMNFVGLFAPKYGAHHSNLNMKDTFPLFAIHDIEKNLKYGINQDQELDLKLVPSFVEDFFADKLEAIVKSEPIPETQEESVYHLVGYEHDQIINSNKDVLVEYYAPWCGHCKRLAPTYEELAALYKADPKADSQVLIAKIDHTANDVAGVDIAGYPTIFLYPGDGSEPIQYEGARDLESLAAFIKEKGTHQVDSESLIKAEVEQEEAVEEEKTEEKKVDSHDEL